MNPTQNNNSPINNQVPVTATNKNYFNLLITILAIVVVFGASHFLLMTHEGSENYMTDDEFNIYVDEKEMNAGYDESGDAMEANEVTSPSGADDYSAEIDAATSIDNSADMNAINGEFR